MAGFKVDTFNRKHTGVRWGTVPIQSPPPTQKKGTASAGFSHRLHFCLLRNHSSHCEL